MKRAERYLWKLKIDADTIRRREEDLNARRAALGLLGISYDALRVQTSPRDKMCDGVAALLDAFNMAFKEIAQAQREMQEVEKNVRRLSPIKQDIIFDRFRYGKDLRTIARNHRYSLRHVYRLYDAAVEEIDKMVWGNDK